MIAANVTARALSREKARKPTAWFAKRATTRRAWL